MSEGFLWSLVEATTLKQWLFFGTTGVALVVLSVLKTELKARPRSTGRAPESSLEYRLLGLIDGAGLPRPEPQYLVPARGRRFRLDFAYSAPKVVVEVDGPFHISRHRRALDRERDDALAELGWRTLRITASDLDRRPREVTERLRSALNPTEPQKEMAGAAVPL